MAAREVLVLAMTYMRSGICAAGFLQEPDEVTHLCWVRPVKEHDTLRLADMTDAAGRIVQCSDVIELDLRRACPAPPHTEDWLADLVYHRPRLLRRLEGDQRARFLADHVDRAPQDVLIGQTRSLCLVRPEKVWARFQIDPPSGEYKAHLGFSLGGLQRQCAASPGGIAVTDIKWRALGRSWLGQASELALSQAELTQRLGASNVYLALGLSRGFRGEHWPLVIGVHVVPDYEVTIDYRML